MTTKIIVNSPFKSTWAARDIKALQKEGLEVNPIMSFAEGLFLGVFWTIWLLLRYRNAIWIHQSAGPASFIPCLLGKVFGHKNIIIAVGTDSACFPEIDYGNFRKLTMRLPTVVSMKNAELICPVHASMEGYDYTYWDVQHKRQGFKAFIPSLTTPVFPIENGFDSKKWSVVKPYSERKFDAIAVFVGGIDNRSVLKGADLVLAVSKRNPDLRFKIIGDLAEGAVVPKNCFVASNCSQSELAYHYNDAKLFLQPSITEGFPNTLGEAMACGCFPIGSRVSSIPEIIGKYGYVLNRRDDIELEGLIIDALQRIADGVISMQDISDSIFTRYSIERRTQRLLQAIEQVA